MAKIIVFIELQYFIWY